MRLDLKIDRDLAFEQALFEIPYHKKSYLSFRNISCHWHKRQLQKSWMI